MGTYRVMSVMFPTSGIAKDASTNTWHFNDTGEIIPGATVRDHWQTFMRAISTLFPSTVAQTGHTLRIYDLADPEPRAPIYDGTWSFSGAPGGAAAPPELCIVTSFQATRESGVLQSRRRGRLYLGPLKASVVDVGRISPTDQGTIATATKGLVDNLYASGADFAVYSRVESAAFAVTNGWVDNAVDVQRRRGLTSTARTTWTRVVP